MIRPLRDRIVVRPLTEKLSSVIEVVELGKPKPHRGEVIAVGPQVKFSDHYSKRTATDTQVGDVIQFTDIYKFPHVDDRGERFLILQEADVCFIEEAA